MLRNVMDPCDDEQFPDCLQVVSARWTMAAVTTCVWTSPGALCVPVGLDMSSQPMERSVKVCGRWKLYNIHFTFCWAFIYRKGYIIKRRCVLCVLEFSEDVSHQCLFWSCICFSSLSFWWTTPSLDASTPLSVPRCGRMCVTFFSLHASLREHHRILLLPLQRRLQTGWKLHMCSNR